VRRGAFRPVLPAIKCLEDVSNGVSPVHRLRAQQGNDVRPGYQATRSRCTFQRPHFQVRATPPIMEPSHWTSPLPPASKLASDASAIDTPGDANSSGDRLPVTSTSSSTATAAAAPGSRAPAGTPRRRGDRSATSPTPSAPSTEPRPRSSTASAGAARCHSPGEKSGLEPSGRRMVQTPRESPRRSRARASRP